MIKLLDGLSDQKNNRWVKAFESFEGEDGWVGFAFNMIGWFFFMVISMMLSPLMLIHAGIELFDDEKNGTWKTALLIQALGSLAAGIMFALAAANVVPSKYIYLAVLTVFSTDILTGMTLSRITKQ